MADETLKQLIVWLRDDFCTFKQDHITVHNELNKSIENLSSFKWRLIGGASVGATLCSVLVWLVANFVL